MKNILDFGAIGDGVTMNTAAIQHAVDAAAQTHETLLIPAGTFLSGTIDLKGVSMHLESGAVLKASGDLADYPVQPYRHNEMGDLTAFIVNLWHDNVTIDGSGTIDFSGDAFYDPTDRAVPPTRVPFTEAQALEFPQTIRRRPGQCLFFHGSCNITVRGIRLINSPCWTLTCSECENAIITGLHIDTDLTIPNDDGIHISACKGVTISDCHISSGDDCIALSCITNWEKPCEDVVITNCVLKSCSKALVLGYQYSVVRHVMISNVIIRDSNRGLCIMCNDEGGLVEDVQVSNMYIDTYVRAGNWWGNGEPLMFMAVKQDQGIPQEQNPNRKTDCAIRNVHVHGVSCVGENAMAIYNSVPGIVYEVSLTDVSMRRKDSRNLPLKGAQLDLSPAPDIVPVPMDCGLYISKGTEVALERINLHGLNMITEG